MTDYTLPGEDKGKCLGCLGFGCVLCMIVPGIVSFDDLFLEKAHGRIRYVDFSLTAYRRFSSSFMKRKRIRNILAAFFGR